MPPPNLGRPLAFAVGMRRESCRFFEEQKTECCGSTGSDFVDFLVSDRHHFSYGPI